MITRLLARLVLGLMLTAFIGGCAGRTKARVPIGDKFPSVRGTALSGEVVALPEAFGGKPVVLIVAYKQKTQFDCDRWLIGLTQVGFPHAIYEVPTLMGMGARLAGGFIDSGMRKGIPRENWSSVVTVYKDAPKITTLTGNEPTLNARVMLLDADGKIVWFHDRGFSHTVLMDLQKAADSLPAGVAR